MKVEDVLELPAVPVVMNNIFKIRESDVSTICSTFDWNESVFKDKFIQIMMRENIKVKQANLTLSFVLERSREPLADYYEGDFMYKFIVDCLVMTGVYYSNISKEED